ncbi:Maf family protein [Cellulomonas alba]|uniref:Nucleoside triphosphate pyrophosphatase n=1 Tax=Cellulomonas alba TaxID=3053467 RepID=A0ABT7SHR9_9CELL|nr:nucleoside triphosphate pyrophosphatase [Cellulomonas alba]MDM7855720.1 nucleoside triphosphate pyrophosphatase [Cellulomonas alba]
MTRLLLASASPARRATLRAAGIDPLVAVSSVDEDAVLAAARERFGALDPADAVLVLAQAKAEDVARALDDGARELVVRDADGEPATDDDDLDDVLLLGCDSMLELDGEVLGKPTDADDAVRRWRAMRGRTGVLHTGHWLVDLRPTGADGTGTGTGATFGATASTTVHFADVSDAEVAAYVATGEPLLVAGAFTVDGLGGPFVESIEGDHHNVVGLSLPLLRELLGELDVTVTDLWRS